MWMPSLRVNILIFYYHLYFSDISGPGKLIFDADLEAHKENQNKEVELLICVSHI